MIDLPISAFISRHHVLTLATTIDNQPWCSNMFYAFDDQRAELIFTSSSSTRHIKEALCNAKVAVSIVLESKVVGNLKGVQIVGRLRGVEKESDDENRCKKRYLKRFPYAVLHLDDLWVVEIDSIKYTDNTLGFGKKLYYQR